MADSDNTGLVETTRKEMAEFSRMLEILHRKQEAISKLDTEAIRNLVSEELNGLKRIGSVEKERSQIIGKLGLTAEDLNDPRALGEKLGNSAGSYAKLHAAFKEVFSQVTRLNGIINILLLHSVAFIKQNISILTDNGNRRLVDKKA